jgi:hypothetical protein
MPDKNLTRISKLCITFMDVATKAFPPMLETDALQKLSGSVDSATKQQLADLLLKVEILEDIRIVSKSLKIPYLFDYELSDEFSKGNIALCEMVADICLRAVPPAKFAEFVPEELKNQADADTLRSLGAPKLAGLCEFKKK